LSSDIADGDAGLLDGEDGSGAIEVRQLKPVGLKIGDGRRANSHE
jgi:hypothetical protein